MLNVGLKTDKGRCRNLNEDSIFVHHQKQFCVVADGVGGHNAGDRASRMAVEFLVDFLTKHPLPEKYTTSQIKSYFLTSFEEANSLIYKASCESGASRGMATTCVACHIKENQAYVMNVGDSRAYLIRDNGIIQITTDHSRVQEMISQGLITQEEAEKRSDRNVITRALGGEETLKPDFFNFFIYPSDTIILCSDGLYGEVSEERMIALASKTKTMHTLSRQLVEEANKNGGRDNISVICIRVQ